MEIQWKTAQRRRGQGTRVNICLCITTGGRIIGNTNMVSWCNYRSPGVELATKKFSSFIKVHRGKKNIKRKYRVTAHVKEKSEIERAKYQHILKFTRKITRAQHSHYNSKRSHPMKPTNQQIYKHQLPATDSANKILHSINTKIQNMATRGIEKESKRSTARHATRSQ